MSRSAARGAVILTCEYPPFPGGIGTVAGRLADEVRAGGKSLTVIAPDYPDLPPPGAEPDVRRILRHHKISPKAALRSLAMLVGASRDRIIFAADIRTVVLAYVFHKLTGRPYRVMIHGSEVTKFTGPSLARSLVRASYLSAETLCSNSAATLALFVESFGAAPQGQVDYLGVEAEWFEPLDGPFDDPRLAALPAQTRVVSTVGRVEPRKGQLQAVEVIAAAQAQELDEAFVYVIAGRAESDTYVAEIEARARALNVSVLVTGRLSNDDLRRLYARSLVQILCAQPLDGKVEGFGLVLLEAAAQRCPTIATRTGGIPEVLGDTGGYLFEPSDVGGMGAKLAELAADGDQRGAAGLAARSRASEFTWRRFARGVFPELFTED
ncbi:glycosyltransferase family 4 protein [Caulobacter sp.]|uniref:glycosyltransferase family 4 protein n=1 Tax=Caulobacter sp. TaxID=78 RepID=UPI003BB1AB7B